MEFDTYWTIRRQTNSRSVKSRTGQLVDYSQLADSNFLNRRKIVLHCTLNKNLTPTLTILTIESVQ